jgi:uncharacterized repeat protein (TIGR01451 family)
MMDAAAADKRKIPIMAYELLYNANIVDGKFEGKDSTGWTNRSGARRYDWEYEVQSAGDTLSITNNLKDYAYRSVGAGGPYDWIPCCFGGTRPDIEGRDDGWPTGSVIATLQADTVLPTKKLVAGNCSPRGINCSKTTENLTCSKITEDLTCKESNCPGYQCVYEFDEGPPEAPTDYERTPSIHVDLDGVELENNSPNIFDRVSADLTRYKITVFNNGEVQLKDVVVIGKLAKGMKLKEGSSKLYEEGGTLNVEQDPPQYNEEKETSLTWSIGTIGSGETKSILFDVYKKFEVDNTSISVKVTSKAPDGSVVNTGKLSADIKECINWIFKKGKGSCYPEEIKAGLCKCIKFPWE